MVEEPCELLEYQKEFFFKIKISKAVELPKNLATKVFVTYQFKFDRDNVYRTPDVKIRNDSLSHSNVAVWNYEKLHTIDKITPSILKDLQEGKIAFQVYSYPFGTEKLLQFENLKKKTSDTRSSQ